MPSLSHLFFHGHKVFSRNFKFLFFAKLLHATAGVLTHFFLPLYLFEWGQEYVLLDRLPVTEFQQGMIAIGGYLLFQRLIILMLTPLASRLIGKIGYRNGMILGQAINVIFLLVMQFSVQLPSLLLVALVIEAIKVPIFWTSYHCLFAETAVYKRMGESVGTLEFFTRLLHVALPALSGFIIASFGFSTLFITGLALQFVSMMVLLLVQEVKRGPLLSLFEQKKNLRVHTSTELTLALAGKYWADALQFVWPFLVVLLIGSVEQVGFLYSLVFFISLLMIYFSGWYVDHSKGRKPLLFSGAVLSVLWLGRATVVSPWAVIAIDSADKLMSSIFLPFYDSLLYKGARGEYALAFFTYREIVICIVAVVFWLLFVTYFFFFESWQPLMVMGFIGMILAMRLKDVSHLHKAVK